MKARLNEEQDFTPAEDYEEAVDYAKLLESEKIALKEHRKNAWELRKKRAQEFFRTHKKEVIGAAIGVVTAIGGAIAVAAAVSSDDEQEEPLMLEEAYSQESSDETIDGTYQYEDSESAEEVTTDVETLCEVDG